MNTIKERLEYLRSELRSETISTGGLLELQSLAEHIAPGDVELLEAAGVMDIKTIVHNLKPTSIYKEYGFDEMQKYYRVYGVTGNGQHSAIYFVSKENSVAFMAASWSNKGRKIGWL